MENIVNLVRNSELGSQGIVSYGNYTNYFYNDMTKSLRQIGVDFTNLRENNQLFVLSSINIDFTNQLKANDSYYIKTKLTIEDNKYIVVRQELISTKSNNEMDLLIATAISKYQFIYENNNQSFLPDVIKSINIG